jgi:hypothetical protein
MAEMFLECLGGKDAKHTFQTLGDRKNSPKDKRLTKILHGTFEESKTELARLNGKGAGIFVAVNETDGKGRKAENIINLRCLWIDDDKGAANAPSCYALRVETSPGKFQYVYKIEEGMTPEQFKWGMAIMEACGGGEAVFIPLLEARVAKMEAREREADAQDGEPRTTARNSEKA